MGLKRIADKSTGFLLLLLIIFVLFSLKPSAPLSGFADSPCPQPAFVQIEGAVQNPGVYPFCAPPTLRELIRKAGGLRQGSDALDMLTYPSIASGKRVSLVYDGKGYQIFQSEMSPFHKVTLGIPISLNQTSEEGFTAIPGIGQKLARTIVEERTKKGGFKDLQEFKGVPGIGQKLYARIRPYLSL